LKDIPYLPEHFQRHGYFTARVCKVGDGAIAGKATAVGRKLWDVSEGADGSGGGREPQPVAGTGADLPDPMTAVRVIQLLEEKRPKPFFIAAGFLRPHEPFRAPQKFYDLYPPDKIVLPKGQSKKTDDEARAYIAGYCASISFMDAQVGLLLDALDRLKLWESTVVIFFSDHGFQLGEHNRWSKPHPFEECCRVPLLIAAPGKRSGAASPRLVELVDVFPTLAQLCGLPVPAGLEGTSMVPLLDDPQRPWKKAAFTTIGKDGSVSCRTERYRFIEDEPKRSQLFDHQRDPLESVNLAQEPNHAAVVAEMRRVIKEGWRSAQP
jgi:iduronate 2-sulfatase